VPAARATTICLRKVYRDAGRDGKAGGGERGDISRKREAAAREIGYWGQSIAVSHWRHTTAQLFDLVSLRSPQTYFIKTVEVANVCRKT
jgi:hypothetical protein